MADGNSYHHGVWLRQNTGGKADRYKKWSDVRKDKTLENLGKKEHEAIVRMNVKKLELQAELQALEKSKRKTSGQLSSSDFSDKSSSGSSRHSLKTSSSAKEQNRRSLSGN